MENLRWILIFAGVAILVLLYFSGRSSSGGQANRGGSGGSGGKTRARPRLRPGRDAEPAGPDARRSDPLMQESRGAYADDQGGKFTGAPAGARLPHDMTADFEGFEVDPDDLHRPASARAPHDFEAVDPAFDDARLRAWSREDAEAEAAMSAHHPLEESNRLHTGARFDGHPVDGYPGDGYPDAYADDRPAGLAETASGALGGLTQKIEAIGARLSSRRSERVAEHSPAEDAHAAKPQQAQASKIVTLHVVARDEGVFDGQALIDCFEGRGLEFGEMNIFHSMYHGQTVFSIAKMVEPGWFDPHELESFDTPGITLILQLPGPVAADTAFEVLLSEAGEIAEELGGRVLDGDRSTLSKQTSQHMREGIYEYMHRQKYFDTVTS